jgi:UDP-3-O-[3-hydroxymyristoyl] N-acetylglucosamine deacetylase
MLPAMSGNGPHIDWLSAGIASAETGSQTTLCRAVSIEGVGLHSGAPVRVRIMPATVGAGLQFARVDLPGSPTVPAHCTWVSDTQMATTLARGRAKISTGEHLLAAMVSLGIDNARIEVSAPEVPILDGSAQDWLTLLEEAGSVEQGVPPLTIVVRRRVEVTNGDRCVRLLPAAGLQIAATIHFPHPAIGKQHLELTLTPESFRDELSWARTFGFLEQVEWLRARGLARGGTLDNALVYGHDGVVNPNGARAFDEPVRHKMLDLVGDVALLGGRLQGRLEAVRPGHGMTLALMQALLADPDAYEIF